MNRQFLFGAAAFAAAAVAGVGIGLDEVRGSGSAYAHGRAKSTATAPRTAAAPLVPADALHAEWVARENAKPGTGDWQITSAGEAGAIEGYASAVSAQHGETVDLHVSTRAESFCVLRRQRRVPPDPLRAVGARDRPPSGLLQVRDRGPDAADRSPLVTVNWRDPPLNRPENAMIGQQYKCNPVRDDMVVVAPGAWVFEGTGVTMKQRLPTVIGPECDAYTPGRQVPPNVQILAHSPVKCGGFSDTTYYSAPSGADVFASGSI